MLGFAVRVFVEVTWLVGLGFVVEESVGEGWESRCDGDEGGGELHRVGLDVM